MILGEFHWQTRNGPTWEINSHGYLLAIDTDAARAEELGEHNSIYSHVLAVGDGLISLLTTASGDLLTSAVVPSRPAMKPILVKLKKYFLKHTIYIYIY